MNKSKLVSPGQAHCAGGMVSDKLMQWGASSRCVQTWMDDENHPLWAEMKRHLVAIKTIRGMVRDGEYDHVDEQITEENFSGKCELGKNPTLMQFHRDDSLDAVLRKIDEAGKRPATIWDLLDFGIKFPREQMKYWIAALGSQVDDQGVRLWCPVLFEFDSGRKIGQLHLKHGWNTAGRFLVVDK